MGITVPFDELGEVPELQTLLINNVETCLDFVSTTSNPDSNTATNLGIIMTTPYLDYDEETTTKQQEQRLKLFFKDLKLDNDSSILRIPTEVNNVSLHFHQLYSTS